MALSCMLCLLQFVIIYEARFILMASFTASKELQVMSETIFIHFVIVAALDFIQGCIYGAVKALE